METDASPVTRWWVCRPGVFKVGDKSPSGDISDFARGITPSAVMTKSKHFCEPIVSLVRKSSSV